MDRPGNAKLKALLKRNTSTSGGGGGCGNKKKQKHQGEAAHPPSISSPDARAKAVELLKNALMEGHRAAAEKEKKKKKGKVEEEEDEEETPGGGTKKGENEKEKGKKGSKTSTSTTITSTTTDTTHAKKAATTDDALIHVSEKRVREVGPSALAYAYIYIHTNPSPHGTPFYSHSHIHTPTSTHHRLPLLSKRSSMPNGPRTAITMNTTTNCATWSLTVRSYVYTHTRPSFPSHNQSHTRRHQSHAPTLPARKY